MKLPRRRFLHGGRCRCAARSFSQRECTAYPTKPIRWIIGFPAGGGADTVAVSWSRRCQLANVTVP
jgi:tripartite-type tricarboxylate transporter receptor subunit TctC